MHYVVQYCIVYCWIASYTLKCRSKIDNSTISRILHRNYISQNWAYENCLKFCNYNNYNIFWKVHHLCSYLCPGYPSEYLLFRQEPWASRAARLQKFCQDKQAQCKDPEQHTIHFFFMLIDRDHRRKYNLNTPAFFLARPSYTIQPQSKLELFSMQFIFLLETSIIKNVKSVKFAA